MNDKEHKKYMELNYNLVAKSKVFSDKVMDMFYDKKMKRSVSVSIECGDTVIVHVVKKKPIKGVVISFNSYDILIESPPKSGKVLSINPDFVIQTEIIDRQQHHLSTLNLFLDKVDKEQDDLSNR